MGRYTGPVCRQCRREGTKLFLKGARCMGARCALETRNYGPGQHGQGRKKVSDYGLQLREKQKVKRLYAVYERQFRGYFQKAVSSRGVTGEAMLRLLELRLDNVVFRSGLVSSRAEARQMVLHRHFSVDGRCVNVPSFRVNSGMVITVRDRSRNLASFEAAGAIRRAPTWMIVDPDARRIEVVADPPRNEMALPDVREQFIVEYYSR